MQDTAQTQQTEQQVAAALVERIGQGDRDAEGELVERYSRGLLALLTARTGDRELAKDLRQDTYCIALEKLRNDRLAEPERLSAYLSGIARNLVIGDVRKKSRRKTTSDTDFLQHCSDETPGQFQQVSRAQVARLVRRLLDELPVERDRELLTRFYVYDQDKELICEELELDSLHFNRVLFRAKKRLRELVESVENSEIRLIK